MSTVKLKCDTCKREIEILEKREGLNSFNKCIITKGCRGKLFKVSRNQYNVREFLPEPNSSNISNFFPRRAFFKYVQSLPSNVWKIQHNMGIYPSVVVYKDTDENYSTLPRSDYNINIINDKRIDLIFESPITGTAHCVARSTKDLEVPPSETEDGLIQITNNNVLSLAVLGKITRNVINPADPNESSIFTCDPDFNDLKINISIKEPERDEIFCTEDISTHLEPDSPWIDWDALISRKRRNYCIKSVDLKNFISIQEFYNNISDIPDGTQLKIISVNYGEGFKKQDVRSRNILGLLSDPPFTNIDKRRDILIDIGEIAGSRTNDSFTFINGELFLSESNVEKIYPPLEKSDPITKVEPLEPLTVQMNNQPFTGYCMVMDSDPNCESSYQITLSDYNITDGSGDYNLFWGGPSSLIIENTNDAEPLLKLVEEAGNYTFTGNLLVVDNITGQFGISPFTYTANHVTPTPLPATATPTPTPTPTNTPLPATVTPTPAPTNTPLPATATPTSTPEPATATPTPTPTNTPLPATATPTPTPEPAVTASWTDTGNLSYLDTSSQSCGPDTINTNSDTLVLSGGSGSYTVSVSSDDVTVTTNSFNVNSRELTSPDGTLEWLYFVDLEDSCLNVEASGNVTLLVQDSNNLSNSTTIDASISIQHLPEILAPTPTPTNTPVPATATPTPTPTNTPLPATATPTSTPVPATATPTPTPTNTPLPATATPTSTPEPATATPTPTPEPAVTASWADTGNLSYLDTSSQSCGPDTINTNSDTLVLSGGSGSYTVSVSSDDVTVTTNSFNVNSRELTSPDGTLEWLYFVDMGDNCLNVEASGNVTLLVQDSNNLSNSTTIDASISIQHLPEELGF